MRSKVVWNKFKKNSKKANFFYRYRVRILKTFDSTGTLKRYVGGIANYSIPHFYGAGNHQYAYS